MKKLRIAVSTLALAGLFVSPSAKAQHQPTSNPPERDFVQKERLDRDEVLLAQAPALFCYTAYGRYPMVVALPPGVSCTVPNVPYSGWLAYGITGY
jgi:hypothetical protein